MEEISSEQIVAEKQPWYRIWWRVYSSPSVQTYQSLAHLQGATLSRATTWVVIATAVTMLIPLVLYWLSGGLIVHDDLSDAVRIDGDELIWIFYIIGGVIAIFVTAILFQISVAIINWLAQKLGGSGEADALGFLIGAILAPGQIADSLLELLPILPGLVLRLGLILFQAGLIVLALRATKTLSWARAIGVIAIFGGIFLLFAGLFLACILFARS
jgi:hypothetical protein